MNVSKGCQMSKGSRAAEPLAGRRLLVVDDEPDLREVICDELRLAGATAIEAENGTQAFQLVQEQHFDTVISDIRMPGEDGISLAKKIKARAGPPPAVFLITGFSEITAAEVYGIGVEGFILKPFNMASVIHDIERILTAADRRWSVPPQTVGTKDIQCKASLAETVASGLIKIGRGGIFLSGNFSDTRRDVVLNARFDDGGIITGVVRWQQQNEGIGVEILSLSDPALKYITDWIEKNNPRPYIPS